MTKIIARLGSATIMLFLVTACVVAPQKRQDPLGQCIQDNYRNHDEVWQLYQQANSAGRISPAEARQFQAIERRLDDIRYNLSREGLSLYDCQRISREIASERANVQRMAATPAYNPQLGQCIQDNRRNHDDVWQLFQRASSAGRISAAERREFHALEGRLNEIKKHLYRDGLTMSDCQRISREIANERANVQRMAATPARNPQLTQCIQENRRNHEEVWQLFRRASSKGRISPEEKRHFQALEERLDEIKKHLSRDGLTMHDCQRIGREIDKERAIVKRMADSGRHN